MAYLEEISLRSSETFRQWFKKLQCVLPGNYSKNNMKSNTTKLLQLHGNVISDDVFPSQQNLDVIMNTLRRDLVSLLRKSECSNLITLLIYKLNILDNNIREVCRFQHTWANHPLSSIESLKVQEKYIIRLIEEIMDDIFDAYSSIRRRMHQFSFNERNINGIISVLGILKKEVCNMIHVIIASIEQRHNSTFYERICAPPNAIGGQYMESIDNRKIEFQLPYKSYFETGTTDKKKKSKSSQVSLPNYRSNPSIERNNGRLFTSLQNICGLASSQLKENSDHFNELERKDVPKNNCDIQGLSRNFFSNFNNRTDGRGDADKNHNDQNEINFTSMHNSVQLNHKHGISKSVNPYFAYMDKNKSSLLSYNKDHWRSKNIKENRETIASRKNGNREQGDDSRANLGERMSKLSWPSVTVVRDIKSEMNLDGTSKSDRLGRNSNYKGYFSTGESSKENLSDSDSDESYISCALDDFQLDMNFMDHIKEKYLQSKSYKNKSEDYAERNNTKRFSCKSPKLSEIFAGPRIIRRKEGHARVSEVYHSIESLPTLPHCSVEEMSNDHLRRETKCMDVAISTDEEMYLKALEYKKESRESFKCDMNKPISDHRMLIDSFNTLALSEDCGGYDARCTASIVSFASVATETEDVKNNDKDIPSFCNNKSLQQERALQYLQDANPNLEDSQYSAICLALPPSSIRLINIGNEVNLLAIEVEQT